MADKIKVSTSEMFATITKYNSAQSEMNAAQKSMKAALDNLNGCWKGVAWAAMMAKWTQIEANILHSQEAVARSVMSLANSIGYYDTTENENKGIAQKQELGSASSIYVD